MFKNEYVLSVDLKRKQTAIVPTFVQNDTATLVFKIYDNGRPFDLTNFTKAEITTIRKDGQVVIGVGQIETTTNGHQVRYAYLGNEMKKEGFAHTSLTLFSGDTRVSIQPFKINVVGDIRDAIGASQEFGVLQELIVLVNDRVADINQAVTDAKDATTNTNTAISDANTAATNANTAATNADEKALLAQNASTEATTNADLANTSATNADEKATLAQEASILANTAATNANTAKDLANTATSKANVATALAESATTGANQAKTDATTAANNANIAKNNANQATLDADTATQNANEATSDTLLAKQQTEQAISNANTATINANNAASDTLAVKDDTLIAINNAETATQNANNSATNAQTIVDNTGSVGSFVLGKAYKKNNSVLDNGSTWIALINTQNNPLPILPITENTWWRLVAQRGIDGEGSVSSVNGTFPDVNGNVTIDLGDSITSVDGFAPDPNGNVVSHTNKDILDGLTDDAGQLKYNGTSLEKVTDSNSKLATKVDKVAGKQLSTEDFTTTEKTKLSGIATNANNYTHPATHPPSIIAQDASNRFMTDAEKTKLSGIATNANNYTHPANHSPSIITQDASNRFVTDTEKNTWNAKASTSVATTSANGLMSSSDKTKLNGIETGAQVNTITSVNDATGAITGLATDTSVDNKIGVLNDLGTAEKTNLVGAVNEVVNSIAVKANQADLDSTNAALGLKANQSDVNTINNTLSFKTDKTYVDQQISNIGSGSPKGTYATLSALQSAFPSGTIGIYLVLADGKWYYWNGSVWTAGGTYQSTGIADGAVSFIKRTSLGNSAFLTPSSLVETDMFKPYLQFDILNKKIVIPSESSVIVGNKYYRVISTVELPINKTLYPFTSRTCYCSIPQIQHSNYINYQTMH